MDEPKDLVEAICGVRAECCKLDRRVTCIEEQTEARDEYWCTFWKRLGLFIFTLFAVAIIVYGAYRMGKNTAEKYNSQKSKTSGGGHEKKGH